MPHDEPTLPDLSDASTRLDLRRAPTLLDLRRRQPQRTRTPPPQWPMPPRERERRPTARGRSPFRWVIALTLGASSVLLLSLLSLLAVISFTGHTGLFAPGGTAGHSASAASAASPSSSVGPASGWLQVAPASVQFGCADHQRTQIVVLENHGPGQVHWQASLSAPADQAGVVISPGNGDLGAGESTVIQLQSTSQTARQQEVITFSAADASAGPPASVSVAAVGCS